MKRPTFRLDGRQGWIRGKDPSGQPYSRTGRVGQLWREFHESVLAGTAESEAEMALSTARTRGDRHWHRIHVEPEEAYSALMSMKLGGRTAVRRCLNIRSARVRRGLPITNSGWGSDVDVP